MGVRDPRAAGPTPRALVSQPDTRARPLARRAGAYLTKGSATSCFSCSTVSTSAHPGSSARRSARNCSALPAGRRSCFGERWPPPRGYYAPLGMAVTRLPAMSDYVSNATSRSRPCREVPPPGGAPASRSMRKRHIAASRSRPAATVCRWEGRYSCTRGMRGHRRRGRAARSVRTEPGAGEVRRLQVPRAGGRAFGSADGRRIWRGQSSTRRSAPR